MARMAGIGDLARSGWCWRMSLRRTHNSRSSPAILGRNSLFRRISFPVTAEKIPCSAWQGIFL
jgi:hypothetical protein